MSRRRAIYQTNADYDATIEAWKRDLDVGPGKDAPKGLFDVWIKGPEKTHLQLSPRGKVLIDYLTPGELENALKFLGRSLVTNDGEDVDVTLVSMPHEDLDEVRMIQRRLIEFCGEEYSGVLTPGISDRERREAAVEVYRTFMDLHAALTRMNLEEASRVEGEEKAARVFQALQKISSDVVAGCAMWLCWLNKDIASDVLEAMLPKNPEEVRTCE